MSPFLLASTAPLEAPAMSPWVGLAVGLLLVLLNGFFVAAEFALVKVRPTQIEPHVKTGDRRAKVASHMIQHLDAYLSSTQLGITLASLALGWVGEPAFAWVLDPVLTRLFPGNDAAVHSVSLSVAFLTISVLHIVLGELAPKSLAIRKPEATSLWIAIPLFAFFRLTYPAIWVLNHAANGLLRAIGIEPLSGHELGHSEEELRLLLGSRAAEISGHKRELLDNIFELSHRTARQIMVPRADVVYLSTERSFAENLAAAKASGHTRFPLCEGGLDKVVGLIHIKDLFRAAAMPESLEEVQRPIAVVPETLPLDRLLRRMRAERLHLAAVLDEYGGVSGIVSLENVIEEIVGEIQDEFDRERPELIPLGDGVYEIVGSMLVADLEDELELELSDRDEDTIGGVVLSEIGRRPRVGDRVELGPVTLEVMEVQGARVQTLRATVLEAAAEG